MPKSTPTVNIIFLSALLSENLQVEETLDGMSQPHYLTEDPMRINNLLKVKKGQD